MEFSGLIQNALNYQDLSLFLGLLVLFIVMLLRGDLVPRKQHEDQRINADLFKTAWHESEELRKDQEKLMVTSMNELHTTVKRLIEALPDPTESDDS